MSHCDLEMSVAEYEVYKRVFKRIQPELAASPDLLRQEMASYDRHIAELESQQPADWEAAVRIYRQLRNFAERYLAEFES